MKKNLKDLVNDGFEQWVSIPDHDTHGRLDVYKHKAEIGYYCLYAPIEDKIIAKYKSGKIEYKNKK